MPMALDAKAATRTAEFLASERAAIVDAALSAVVGAHASHYAAVGRDETLARLEALFDRLIDTAGSRDVGGVVAYARQLAGERFSAGYDLSEVQIAINALEEAVWRRIFSELQADELAIALGIVSTTLGTAKDALAREYVSLATHTRAPSLDLSALFAGVRQA